MSAQSVRLNTTSSNIANAESVASSVDQTYRARHPVFMAQYTAAMGQGVVDPVTGQATAGVNVAGIVESNAPLQQRYEPDHPYANEEGYVAYPNVNVVEEMTNMISASRSFQTNADVMNTAKQMMSQVLNLGQ
jgi:flagellar basal-body rod protein FlgC